MFIKNNFPITTFIAVKSLLFFALLLLTHTKYKNMTSTTYTFFFSTNFIKSFSCKRRGGKEEVLAQRERDRVLD